MSPYFLTIFVLANLGIMLGYFYVSVFVAPHFKINTTATKVGGVLFFLTCGITHLEMAIHALYFPDEGARDLSLSWHMILNHVVQVFAIWVFVTGLYRQFVVGPRLSRR